MHAPRRICAGRRGRAPDAALLALCALAACTTGRESVEPLPAEFVITVDRAANVPPGTLFLKPIPGGLLGPSVDSELFRSPPGASDMRISTPALSAGANAHARPVRADRFNPGELASPRGIRIARIGTFYEPAASEGECSNFRTGLGHDDRARELLVYVDRAGTVRGQRYTSPYIMDYQLDFPRAGIYVVTWRTQGIVVTQRTVRAAGRLQANVRRAACD